MRLSSMKMWALLLTGLFVGSVSAASIGDDKVTPQQEAQPTVLAGTSPRIVIAELFTATNCVFCQYADPAISRLADEYPNDQLVVIAYHVWASDPYYDARWSARGGFYNVPGIPAVVVDGGGPTSTGALWVIGAGAETTAYTNYKGKITNERAVTTNLQITMAGDLTATMARFTANIYASDPVPELSLNARFVLYEDGLYAMGSNTEPFHRYVVRDMYEQPLSIIQGQTVTISYDFLLDPAWDSNKLGVVAFVQSDVKKSWVYDPGPPPWPCYNAPVLQSAMFHYVRPNTLYFNDGGTNADYEGYFERPFSFNGRPFQSHNMVDAMDSGTVDIRGVPTLAEMEEFGAVVWNTAGETSGTLTPTDTANLGGYLSGYGSLFVTGRALGAEINPDPFFGTYLHATYTSTNPNTFVNGVAGDPITGAWTATQLQIAGTPSDQVEPTMGAYQTIVYLGGVGAGVRADHDSDSRVLYFGVNYFHSTTENVNRKYSMMDNILNWFDGVAGPRVTLLNFNGGGEYTPGDIAPIMWKAIDVEIPKGGVDLYYTTDLTTPSWVPIAFSEPNDGLFYWTIPNENTNNCGVRVVARDGDIMTMDGEAISAGPCTIGAPNVVMTKDVSNPTPQVSETIYYTITLTNLGSVAAYATVTDSLPVGATYVSDDGDTTGVSNYFAGNRTVAWTVAVQGMFSVSLRIDVTVDPGPPGTTVVNWAFFNSTNAQGGSQQSDSDSASFQIPSLENWQLTLAPGKYLLSIPLQLMDYRIEFVLASIATKYNYVRAYDASERAWKSYVPGRSYNTLREIRPEMGFWINMTQGGTIFLTGARPISTAIMLKAGWNLVGYPSAQTTYTVALLKADLPGAVVDGFDPTAGPYLLQRLPDNYALTEAKGYWVYVPNDTTWLVVG